jgi:hypothetical protein
MSNDQKTSRSAAKVARATIQTVADNNFIAAADIAIAEKTSLGQYMVSLDLFENVSLQNVVTYYQNLGYVVSAPFPPNVGNQPAQLFGEVWDNYWFNQTFWYTINGFPRPKTIFISWYNEYPNAPDDP